MRKYIIKLNGKSYEVEMEEVTGEIAATRQTVAQPVPAAPVAPAPAPAAPAKPVAPAAPVSGGETMLAPMPGTILSISVQPGDTVKKNQILLILEAMKMENEIVSPIDGKVLSVGVNKGDMVNPGDLLVQIG